MTDKMQPCPMCGGQAVIRHEYDPDMCRWTYVACEDCGTRTRGDWVSHSSDACPIFYEGIRDAWNRRAAPSPGMPSDALRHAGAMLSNCAFNLAQRKPGEPLTEADIRALDESRRAWDAALRSPADQGEKDRKDAERYRWLRNEAGKVPGRSPFCAIGEDDSDCSYIAGASLDDAIDSTKGRTPTNE